MQFGIHFAFPAPQTMQPLLEEFNFCTVKSFGIYYSVKISR